jgi:chemotaxis protein methyltransferase CheR
VTDLFTGIINIEDAEFNYLKDIVYQKTGIALASHKKIMLQSRLNIRLRHNQIVNFKDYVSKLKSDKTFFNNEIPEIINRITTNKTDFYRENHHFEYLKNTFLPQFEDNSKKTMRKKLRIWCSAASTGEEPYTIAITLLDYFQNKPGWDIKIIASDIDTNVLAIAEKGVYKEDRVTVIRSDIKQKYFTVSENGKEKEYTVKPILKSILEFKKINLLEEPYPFRENFDLIFCRNVIIYFDKKTQTQIFTAFEKNLYDEGILIIGHSETLFGISDSFKFLGQTIYQKKTK